VAEVRCGRAGPPVIIGPDGRDATDARLRPRPPASARANLHTYVCDLRRLPARTAPADDPRPTTTATGYRLDLAVDEYDASRFASLVAGARRSATDGLYRDAAERFARARALWQGQVLQDLGPYGWVAPFATQLE
jgi:DNA-binding SARP family transcriptional activator